jgi:hypothetical protein
LAQKVRAARAKDRGDIKLLLRHLKVRTAEEVIKLVERIYPGECLSERQRIVLDDCLGEVWSADPGAVG